MIQSHAISTDDMAINIAEISTVDDLNGRETMQLVAIAKKHSDQEILLRLVRHPSSIVRIAITQNPNLTAAVVDVLKVDDDASVREALSLNEFACDLVGSGGVEGRVKSTRGAVDGILSEEE